MRKKFTVAPRAKQDLSDLLTYLAEDDTDTAFRVVDEIEDLFQQIADTPFGGHTREDLGIDDRYRVWPIYSWLVIYLPDRNPLEIVRVWHSAQHSPKL